MITHLRHQSRFRRICRGLLFVFIVSWLNLVFQAPVHAAMKLDRMLAEQAGIMQCHCPPPICDTVLSSVDDQSVSGIHTLNPALWTFHAVAINTFIDNPIIINTSPHHSVLNHNYRQTSPPPLLLKTVLLI